MAASTSLHSILIYRVKLIVPFLDLRVNYSGQIQNTLLHIRVSCVCVIALLEILRDVT